MGELTSAFAGIVEGLGDIIKDEMAENGVLEEIKGFVNGDRGRQETSFPRLHLMYDVTDVVATDFDNTEQWVMPVIIRVWVRGDVDPYSAKLKSLELCNAVRKLLVYTDRDIHDSIISVVSDKINPGEEYLINEKVTSVGCQINIRFQTNIFE